MKRNLLLWGVLVMTLATVLLGAVACRPADGGTETEASTAGTMADTPEVTEPETGAGNEETTAATITETTEPEETRPPFELTALPVANVAREGFALTSGVKHTNEALYSNVNLLDGDRARGYSSEWGDAFDASREHFVFVDLTEVRVIDSLRLYPLAGDEGGFPVDFDVLISQDGKAYTPHTSVSGMTPEAGGYTVDMGDIEAKYVKLIFTKLGEGNAERGVHISIGELEVYSPIDTATNMQLNLDDIWLFKDPDTTHQLAVTYYRDGRAVDPEKPLYYESRDPAIATVSEDGLITPVGYGQTEIYVYDGENRGCAAVEVVRDVDAEDFLISTFFITYYVTPEKLEEAIDLTVSSGVTHLEAPHWWDHYSNDIHLYALHLCRVRGATYTPNDENPGILQMSDEQIQGVVKQYENMAGVHGLFITDEPSTNYTQYAEVYRVLQEYNPHYMYYLNLLPLPAVPGAKNEYYTEFASVAGGARRMKYLTFDQYPFGWGNSFDSGIFHTLEMMRRAGLQYNADTGFYMQSQIMQGAYDALTLEERRYSASMAMAYGMKEYKHYLGLCPIDAGCKPTNYLSGILKNDYTPADYYDDIVEVNAYIKTMGKYLANFDAVEVYHNRPTDGEMPPTDFFLKLVRGEVIVSVFREIEGTRQYLLLTDKQYAASGQNELSFTIRRDVGALQIFDPMTGETRALEYTVGEPFTLSLMPGQCLLIIPKEGVDLTAKRVESDNLMLGKGVFASSSKVDFWVNGVIGTHFLTDGDPANGMWLSGSGDKTPNLLLDLGLVQSGLGTLEIFMNDHLVERQYMEKFTVEVSVDGVTYTQVANIKDASYDNETKSYRIDLGGVEARYIRLQSTAKKPVAVGEIAVYKQ